MLNTYIKNRGITQTLVHNNNKNHFNKNILKKIGIGTSAFGSRVSYSNSIKILNLFFDKQRLRGVLRNNETQKNRSLTNSRDTHDFWGGFGKCRD